MNRSLWITLAFGLLGVVALYSLPKVVIKPKVSSVRDSKTDSLASNKETAPAAASTEEAHSQALTSFQQKEFDQLHESLVKANDTNQKIAISRKLLDFFTGIKQLDSAAHYAAIVANLEPSERNMLVAGDRYYDAFTFAAVEAKQKMLAEKTRNWYQKVLDKNPNVLIAKANMAMTFVSSDNPMQGIMMLREIIAIDPTNEVALFNLGLLSIRSNQYQKAVDRFNQVLKNNPANSKARFYLGVSLAQLGKNKEALAELAKVKQTEKEPNILQAIGELEKELK